MDSCRIDGRGEKITQTRLLLPSPSSFSVASKGGSLDGAGPVVVGGMIYVNSGYPRNGGMPGNVLLAFGPEE